MKRLTWLSVVMLMALAACQPAAQPPDFQPQQTLPPYPPPQQPAPLAPVQGGYPAPQTPASITGGGYPAPGQVEAESVSWEQARTLILSGQVAQIFQLHNLTVTLALKDGRVVTTREPAIDDVFAVVEDCGAPCADILIATE